MMSFGSCHEVYGELDSVDVVGVGDADADLVGRVVFFAGGIVAFDDDEVGFLGGEVADALPKPVVQERDGKGFDEEE